MDTQHRLGEIFRAVFNLPPDADMSRVRQVNHPGWDSLAHVTLMGAIESEFGLTIDVGDSLELTSFDAVLLFLETQAA